MRCLAFALLFVVPSAFAQEGEAPEPVPEAPAKVTPAPPEQPPPALQPHVSTLAPCPAQTTVLPQPDPGCLTSPKARPWLHVARIGVEAILGAGLGALGEIVGLYAGINADVLAGNTETSPGTIAGVALGALISVAPGVYLGGRVMGGDGSFGWTLIGGALGTGVGAIIIAIKSVTATAVIGAAMPVIGSILGYELSAHAPTAAAGPSLLPASSGVTLVPSFGPTHVGVSGSF